MGCDVFANGDEIACKAGDNKVIAAFPDVCLSPPSPPAGPLPVPYPNTSFSKDMQNGSKTVMIKGKEVMLKDQSFYKTSPIGDEAATNGLGASVITHVITGKTYCVSWSMDVKFEGQNVDRHTDITSSNHASKPGSRMTPIPTTATGAEVPLCTTHTWGIVDDSEMKYTADQKKDRLRKSKNVGDAHEAAAADHNGVKDGNCMSGPNEKSKLYQVCQVCHLLGNEVDHVKRDASGKAMETVEVKSGGCNIDLAPGGQHEQAMAVARDLGATHKYKLTGKGAALGQQALINSGFPPGNIIIF
jgi:hypothetical protein